MRLMSRSVGLAFADSDLSVIRVFFRLARYFVHRIYDGLLSATDANNLLLDFWGSSRFGIENVSFDAFGRIGS